MFIRSIRMMAWLVVAIAAVWTGPADASPINVGDRICVMAAGTKLDARAAKDRLSEFDCGPRALEQTAPNIWLYVDLQELAATKEDPALLTRLSHHGGMVIAPIFADGQIRPQRYAPLELTKTSFVPGFNAFPILGPNSEVPTGALIGVEQSWDPLNWADIELVNYQTILDTQTSSILVYSLLTGILLTPLVLVLLIYPVVRYSFLPHHFGMLASALFYAFSWTGLIFVLPIDITPVTRSVIDHMAIALAFFFAANLTRTLCGPDYIGRFWYDALPIAGVIPVIVSAVAMATAPAYVHVGSMVIHATAILPMSTIVISLTIGALKRSRIAQLQLLAWVPMIIYVAGRILRGLGVIDETSILELGLFPSLLLESLLTSALVVFRMYDIRIERDNAVLERAEFRDLASSDALTGALNRRAFVEHFDQTVAASMNRAQLLTLIVIDIDHFKTVNDKYGHAFGDDVLVKVTDFLRDHCRGEDAYARFGGEEFCMLISTKTKSAANACAERLREAIAAHTFDDGLHVTISIGMVTISADKSTTFTSWFEAADKALYAAKQSGRNQVQWSGWRPHSSDIVSLDKAAEWRVRRA
ncbi:MAG: GGDEF domain-containing protein [Pseudomonadota bacterium]